MPPKVKTEEKDCLEIIRELKAIGVSVCFEEQGIDTEKMSGRTCSWNIPTAKGKLPIHGTCGTSTRRGAM